MKKEDLHNRVDGNFCHENKIEIKCVIFCFEQRKLKVLLVKNESNPNGFGWRLPSADLNGEPMLKTANETLEKYLSSNNYFIDQLKAFDNCSSVLQKNISIAFYALARKENTVEEEEVNPAVIWLEANDAMTYLDDKERMMLEFSLKELKKNICCGAVGFNLLAEKFTLLQVVQLYEEILGIKINKVNFRRKILQRNLVRSLDEKEDGVSYRAAKFYILNVPKNEVSWNVKFNFIF